MSRPAPIVIVGAGQAGMQMCDVLRRRGFEGDLTLVGEESALPYQRPPLSKQFLGGDMAEERLFFRPRTYYEKHAVTIRLECRVEAVDRAAHEVVLAGGERLAYTKLGLATGTRVRRLPCPGGDLPGVHYVRTLDDSVSLRRALEHGHRVTVIGGGFIGLEVSAIAAKLGKSVEVVEFQQRLMARAVSSKMSDFYLRLHRSHGVGVRLGCAASAIERRGSELLVQLDGGDELITDVVVAGIGVVPNQELAENAGLACDNGIVVDELAHTTDDDIVAAGDCTSHPNQFYGGTIRLESVQNAVDQARTAAASLVGLREPYASVPWFWSDQFDAKLQIAGLSRPSDDTIVRGALDDAGFSVFFFREGRLAAAESINRPADHMACRKLLAQGVTIAPAQAADVEFNLKNAIQR